MLKIKTKEGDTKLSMKGNIVEIAADVMCAIKSVYNAISEVNPDDAKLLAESVTQVINDPDLTPFATKNSGEKL